MMKKFLCTILLTAAILFLASGCSLFATPADKSGDGSGNTSDDSAGGSSGVQMTEKYTFEDPADLDFDKRYVLYCDENTQAIANSLGERGVLASYTIVYAKDDAPAGSYDFFVCDSAEHAQDLVAFYAAQGQTLTAAESDPCVIYAFSEADTVEATLIMLQGYGMISEVSVAVYAEMMQTSTGGTLLK